MKRKIQEWISIQLVKNPGKIVLAAILFFNVAFFFLASAVISLLSLNSNLPNISYARALYLTITMVLDAGCIGDVTRGFTETGVAITLTCLIIIIVGMISFTGAVIGYVTNYISHFIESSNAGKRRLRISGHTLILNWNSRASEIVNDLLYSAEPQRVVVLVGSRRDEIEQEIEDRISDTVSRENEAVAQKYAHLPRLQSSRKIRKERFRRRLTVIVREGDVFSSKQLRDVSVDQARAVIILGNDINNTLCKFEYRERIDSNERGNSQTIKTLMQVADMTAAETSADNQRIIVEVTDDWTLDLVERIIAAKQVDGKCNIVPVKVNRVLGQILSQFSLMPELNMAYRELFSNKGATFYSAPKEKEDEVAYTKRFLSEHKHAVPLAFMETKQGTHCYYAADSERAICKRSAVTPSDYAVDLNRDYWIERKNVVILGHNSKCRDIMQGFASFVNEWGRAGESIVNLIVIDDPRNLEKMGYYKEFPFVKRTVAAEIYDKDLICSTIEEFVDANVEDTSVLILSDDSALNEDIDANALANLVYVQDIINRRLEQDPSFDPYRIDMVVEIIDPKHHDIINSYNVNNVVISNRYISKMITQISEKESLFEFYSDILTYDEEGVESYDSKEIYVKKVSRFFNEIPKECTAEELIRAVYHASADDSLPAEKQNPSILLGYVKHGGEMVLFAGDQSAERIQLEKKDKVIVFSKH
ncbi:MAG: hypothetical protein IJW71_05210 [Clostridia bacterium]|nr:hypothetical protein [Clostridia bacterium]